MRTTSFGAAVLVFGLLLWARLLLLTGHPKMAMAEPGNAEPAAGRAVERAANGADAPVKVAVPAPASSDATHSPHAGD